MKNKKLIASLTLAGFMAVSFVPGTGLTVAPAFAVEDNVSTSTSVFGTEDANTEVNAGEEVTVKINLLNKLDQAATPTGRVLLWAETSRNIVNDALIPVSGNETNAELAKKGIIVVNAGSEEKEVTVSFARSGKYTLRAAYVANLNDDAAYVKLSQRKVDSDVTSAELQGGDSENKVVTVSADTKVNVFKVDNTNLKDGQTFDGYFAVNSNGIKETEIEVQLFKDKNATLNAGRGVKVKAEANSANINLAEKDLTTDYNGKVTVKVTGRVEGTYNIYLTAEGNEVTVPVKVTAGKAYNMSVTKQDTTPIAVEEANKHSKFKDTVRVELTDANGNVTTNTPNDVIFSDFTAANNKAVGNYVKVIAKPAKSKVEGKNFRLVQVKDKDYYTVVSDKDLVAGKYELRFALESGKTVDVSLEVAEFGKATGLKVEYDTESVALGADVAAPEIYFVDERGVKKKANSKVNLGFNGYAGYDFDASTGSFKVKNDEKYLGAKITVTAVADRLGFVSMTDLTVAQDGRSLKFETNNGVINSNNTVDFKVVDGAGKTVSINPVKEVSAVVVSSTNKDAVVSAAINRNDIESDKGEGSLKLTSNKATTVEVQIFIKDNANKFYAGTLTYTFGESATSGNVNRFVVLSIGNDMANINNATVKIDAAPMVKSNRTFVPFRTIAEAFGAEVGYNDETKKVTAKLNGKTVELTLGSKKIVSGEQEKEMDVEPFAYNSRTMVPVRFVAEEFGFKVTAIRDVKKGGTAAVVFSR